MWGVWVLLAAAVLASFSLGQILVMLIMAVVIIPIFIVSCMFVANGLLGNNAVNTTITTSITVWIVAMLWIGTKILTLNKQKYNVDGFINALLLTVCFPIIGVIAAYLYFRDMPG
jgi:ABC-type transport system involved in multi-copper enzyme maturation permease subunit